MEFENLPYDILLNLLINVKRLYRLRRLNKKLNTIIKHIYDNFNEKFNELVPDWRNNIGELLNKLASKDAFLSLKFLGNNFVEPLDIYKKVLMYGSVDLMNKISEYFSVQLDQDLTMKYVASGDNVKLFKYFYDLGYEHDIEEIIKRSSSLNSIKIIKYLGEINNGLSDANLEIIADNAAKYDFLDLFEFVQSKLNSNEPTVECTCGNGEKINVNEIIFRSILLAVDNESNEIIGYLLKNNFCVCDIAKEAALVGNLDLLKMVMDEYNCESIVHDIAEVAADNGNTDIVDFLNENYGTNVTEVSENDYDVIAEYTRANNFS